MGRFGDRVKTWLTLSDPQIEARKGYDTGEFPPGEKVQGWWSKNIVQEF